MKKFHIKGAAISTNEALTNDNLRLALRVILGIPADVPLEIEVGSVEVKPVPEVGTDTWLYVPDADFADMGVVTGPFEITDQLVPRDTQEQLLATGVCTHFCAQYPGEFSYDPPAYVDDKALAETQVGGMGFAAAENLSVQYRSGGTDKERLWLRIRTPA